MTETSSGRRRRTWFVRIVLGVALAIAFKLAVDFVSSDYYEDVVPPVRDWPGIFLHPASSMPGGRVAVFILCVWAFLFWAGAILPFSSMSTPP